MSIMTLIILIFILNFVKLIESRKFFNGSKEQWMGLIRERREPLNWTWRFKQSMSNFLNWPSFKNLHRPSGKSNFWLRILGNRDKTRPKPKQKHNFVNFKKYWPRAGMVGKNENGKGEHKDFDFLGGLKEFLIESELAWRNSKEMRDRFITVSIKTLTLIPRGDLLLTAVGTLSSVVILKGLFKRYKTASEIPLKFFKQQKSLNGFAILVNDSDNIRFYHQQFLFWWSRLSPPDLARQDLKYNTINVRLAGIDAPEIGHFGSESQPFAMEAKGWLTEYVQGKRVKVILHRLDQYGRAVGSVYVRKWRWLWPRWNNVSIRMLEEGLATVYENGGAEYGGFEEEMRAAEAKAKKIKKGMWQQSKTEYTSPSDYKRMLRSQQYNFQSSPLKKSNFITSRAIFKQ